MKSRIHWCICPFRSLLVAAWLGLFLCWSPAAPADDAPGRQTLTVTDFSRSFIHYEPRSEPIWVRIRIDCRCEVFDPATGAVDEYVLGVRTQTGLRTEPPSDVLDPGYDFWMIFSKKEVYIRRVHTSAYNRNPSQYPVTQFKTSGWHLTPAAATLLETGEAIREATRAWKPLVARTEFLSADGSRGYAIEYPIKWSDGNDDGTFRVETGPVLLLDPEQCQVGTSPQVDDWRWAYLDFRSFDKVRCFLERPTSIFSGALYESPLRINPVLTSEQVTQIENRLFTGWDLPIPEPALRQLLSTDRFSEVKHFPVVTRIYSIDGPGDNPPSPPSADVPSSTTP